MQGWLLVGMGGCDGCLVRFPGKSPGENISPYCYFLFRKVRSKGLWTGLRLIHHISLLSSWAPLALYNSANAVNTITTDRKPTRNHSCNTSCSQWKGNRYFKVGVQENRTRCWWLLFLMRNQEITGIPIESLMLVRNIVLESLENSLRSQLHKHVVIVVHHVVCKFVLLMFPRVLEKHFFGAC